MTDLVTTETTKVADWIAIRELTALYNHSIDDGDAATFEQLFTEDAVVTFRNPVSGDRVISGRSEIAAMANRPPGQLVHATTDARIEIDGDAATQVCTLLLTRLTPGTGASSGRYTDELVRTADGWRFSRRTADLYMLQGA
jgi:ketosteroid isomerase-like protein